MIVPMHPKMCICVYFICPVELFYRVSVPPGGRQPPGKHSSCSHNSQFEPAGGLTGCRLRLG